MKQFYSQFFLLMWIALSKNKNRIPKTKLQFIKTTYKIFFHASTHAQRLNFDAQKISHNKMSRALHVINKNNKKYFT